MPNRKPYPTDASDEEWAFVAPYLALVREDAPQRVHDLRDVFDALRWIVRAGASWRMMPNDFPPWEAVYQQTQRWIAAGVFEAMVHDLRAVLRLASGRAPGPSAAILDSRTLRSSPESGHRAGYDGAKRKKGSKIHAAVDTLGYLLALRVTPAAEKTARRSKSWRGLCRRLRARASSWRTWTRDTRARSRQKRRKRAASDWRWSRTPTLKRASCSCHGSG